MKKFIVSAAAFAIATATALSFTACAGLSDGYMSDMDWNGSTAYPQPPGYSPEIGENSQDGEGDNFVYGDIIENGFVDVTEEPSSYFSLDRNTASFSQVRYQIEHGMDVSPESVRIEELINYFNYDFAAPEEKAIAVSGYIGECPWNESHKLVLAGIKTAEMKIDSTNGNYVFLIDVSGSMSGDNRLGLAKKGLLKLVNGLGEGDKISIVTYASGVSTLLDGGECSESGKEEVRNKINNLKAGGSTFGSGGLQRAYEVAEKNYITGGNNRVIIISDGDFNVGISDRDDMMEYISEKTVGDKSVYLSVLGVGMGNMRDDMLETLARHGNGNYAYLDNETEAEKVLCHELNGTLMTVAKDAKAGVTFTEQVKKYRLIGYDTKIISKDEFEDDTTDAGEIGSNLCIAALYEVELQENAEGNIAEIEVKFKDVRDETEIPDCAKAGIGVDGESCADLEFIACVAEFGLVLRNSKYAENANMSSVLTRLDRLSKYVERDIYRLSFRTLAAKASERYTSAKE